MFNSASLIVLIGEKHEITSEIHRQVAKKQNKKKQDDNFSEAQLSSSRHYPLLESILEKAQFSGVEAGSKRRGEDLRFSRCSVDVVWEGT